MLLIIIIAIASGASTVIARNINSLLADRLGLLEGTFYNYITGLLLSGIFLLLSKDISNLSAGAFSRLPLWAYLGGIVGVAVVTLSNVVTPKISAFYLTLIMFVGQLFTGILIDYFTLGTAPIGKIAGGLLVVAGLGYNLKADK